MWLNEIILEVLFEYTYIYVCVCVYIHIYIYIYICAQENKSAPKNSYKTFSFFNKSNVHIKQFCLFQQKVHSLGIQIPSFRY